jgi:hypothetical protein
MATFNVEVQGLDIVKKLFSDIENQLSAAQLRGILDEAGKVIISQAKSEIPYTGTISEDFKKDLGVYRDRRKSAKNAEYVLVGPRFKPYTIHGKEQKVAVIAQHMTQGFSQSNRKGHGKVKYQTINPVLDAFQKTKTEQNNGINNGIVKRINKIKAANSSVVI